MTEDRYGDRLREILSAEAERVVPKGDGLMNIQARTAERGRRWWTAPAAALGAAALVLAAVVVGVNLAGDDEPAGIGTTAPPSPASSPSPSPVAPAPGSKAVAVYYVKDDGRSLRLYREFQQAPASADTSAAGKVTTAVELMLTQPARDPDYTSLWPRSTTVENVTVDGDLATVDLSAEAKQQQAQSGAEGEARSVQQLVYTVTAADTSIKRVRLLVAGQQVDDIWGHGAVGTQPLTRAPQLDVLGFVWITSPTQDEAVNGGSVAVEGVATVFEATVSVEVVQDGKVVKEAFATASDGAPGRGTWKVTLELEPGDYLIRAFEASAKDGSPQYVDDKAIHVE